MRFMRALLVVVALAFAPAAFAQTEDLGDFNVWDTVYVPLSTYNSSGASVTITGLAVTDIEIYKDGSVTQRASDAGYTLLDTDGIDFDTTTGVHGFSVALTDNTTAGFYSAGSKYWIVVNAITVDSQTVVLNYHFTIGQCALAIGALQTTIATLASQTSFTLREGSADNNAYNGWAAYIRDAATATQTALGIVSAYTGATKTVTLSADPAVFTMAAGDFIVVQPAFLSTGVTLAAGAVNATSVADNAIDNAALNITIAEPSAVPSWGGQIEDWVAYVGAWFRNRVTQTSTTKTLRNDANNGDIVTCAVSDDGTTFVNAECAP